MTIHDAKEAFDLPPELLEFLESGRQFDYDASKCEPGKVTLRGLKELSPRKAWIEPSELTNFAVWNPYHDQEGYFEIPCVSLSLEAEGYMPDGILVWIPKLKLFATFDSGHGIVWLFPDATWGKIVNNPVAYLGAQWNVNPELQALLVPWGLFQFITENPYDDPQAIVS